jgi:hypothetical protein
VNGVSEPIPEPVEPDGPQSSGAAPGEACPLCGSLVVASDMRCSRCGRSLAGLGERPGPFSRRDVVLWVVSLVVIYLVVMLVVLVAR